MKFKKLFNQNLVSNIGFGLFSKYSQINAQFADENEPSDYENKLLEAIFFGLKKGINVIDAAQNYRNGKSEKTIGKVLSKKVFKRDDLVIISKAGNLPKYFYTNNYLNKLKIRRSNYHSKYNYCIDPRYLNWSVDNSLSNMKTEYIDFYLLHNPEVSLLLPNGYNKLLKALSVLERCKQEKKITAYGISSWNGFRSSVNSKFFISIKKLITDVEKNFGPHHGFRCVETPLSVGMPDILNYRISDKSNLNLLEFLRVKNIDFFTSATLYQGKIGELIKLNKIFNSIVTKNRKFNYDYNNTEVSFPKSENSIRQLLILLNKLSKSKIDIEIFLKKISCMNSYIGGSINLVTNLKNISSSLIGMETLEIVRSNIKESDTNLNNLQKKLIYKFWSSVVDN